MTVQLGYWIVEDLVDRSTEHYPRGGIKFLVRSERLGLLATSKLTLRQAKGLKWLSDAGIQVILDHHALPGVQTAGQAFTGKCVLIQILLTFTQEISHSTLI